MRFTCVCVCVFLSGPLLSAVPAWYSSALSGSERQPTGNRHAKSFLIIDSARASWSQPCPPGPGHTSAAAGDVSFTRLSPLSAPRFRDLNPVRLCRWLFRFRRWSSGVGHKGRPAFCQPQGVTGSSGSSWALTMPSLTGDASHSITSPWRSQQYQRTMCFFHLFYITCSNSSLLLLFFYYYYAIILITIVDFLKSVHDCVLLLVRTQIYACRHYLVSK